MPTPKKGPRLGAGPAHQRLMLAQLASQLFEHGRITTTEAKARMLRPVAEKLITKAKKAPLGTVESLHQRRQVLRRIHDKTVVHELFTEIGPSFAERPGGYTRITKIGPRKGDNAPMAVIELVTEPYDPKPARSKAKAEKAGPTAAAEESPAEETEAVESEAVESDEPTAEAEEASVDAEEPEVEQPTAGAEESDDKSE